MTLFAKSWMRRLAVGTLAALACLAAPITVPAHADAKAAIKEIKEFDKDGDGGKGVAALIKLESDLDPYVTKELAKLAEKAKTHQIAIQAMRMVSKRKDPGFMKKLGGLLKDKKDYAKEAESRFVAILKACETYADPKLSKPLWDVVRKYTTTNSDISSAAVTAFGAIRDKKNIETLIKHLPVTENNSSSLSTETKQHLRNTKEAVLDALGTMTGKEIRDTKMWQDFWKENAKDFEFPDPNAPVVDVTKLRAHTDPTYGYHVAMPDRKVTNTKSGEEAYAWNFEESTDSTVRLQARCRDETGFEIIRIEMRVWNASKGKTNSPEKMAEWWENEVRTNLISEFSKEPEINGKVKMNDKEWWVGVARGQPGESQKGWGTTERRFYCTQAEHMLIYAMAIIRTGADDAAKAEAVSMMESITFPEEK